jgi:WD40 repeat protein
VLHADEEAEPIWSIAGLSCGQSLSDGVHAAWLVVGHENGIVRIWDVERARCIARLHATVDAVNLDRIWISPDRGRVVAREYNL